MFEAVLRPAQAERSLFAVDAPPLTVETLDDYKPATSTAEQAGLALQKLGFKIRHV